MEAIFAKVLEVLGSVEAQAAIVAVVVEFAFRLVPSDKPRSILLVVAKACELTGAALSKVAVVLNKVIPQKIK
jgi:hypothetical protein